MMELPLDEAAFVTLDASGNGTASVGPNAHGVRWSPGVVAVRTSTDAKSPRCKIYVGRGPTDDNFMGGTETGNLDSSDNVRGAVLHLGDKVWAVWTGGDVGAQATLSIVGTKDL